NRLSASKVGESLADFRTTGRIRRPLITVAGTMDALLPIDANARVYARRVAAAAREEAGKATPAYRLYEVRNGNHIETFKVTFPQLEFVQPHALQAFDLLVRLGCPLWRGNVLQSSSLRRESAIIEAEPVEHGLLLGVVVHLPAFLAVEAGARL